MSKSTRKRGRRGSQKKPARQQPAKQLRNAKKIPDDVWDKLPRGRPDQHLPPQLYAMKLLVCAPEFPDQWLSPFVRVAEARAFDPMRGECFPIVVDRDKGPVFKLGTTLTGERNRAERTGKYRGSSRPQWRARGGNWVDDWTDENNEPWQARVEIYRSDFERPQEGLAFWDQCADYVRNADGTVELHDDWRGGRGAYRLAKLAERNGLRKAFPDARPLGPIEIGEDFIDDLDIARDGSSLTDAKLRLVHTVACPPRFPDRWVKPFVALAEAAGLDVLAGHVYPLVDHDDPEAPKLRLGITLDGWLAKAGATGKFRGFSQPQWRAQAGEWCDRWTATEHPFACQVMAYRHDWTETIVGIAYWAQCALYQRLPNGVIQLAQSWAGGRGQAMLAEFAKVEALKTAFPEIVGTMDSAPSHARHEVRQ